MPKVPVLVAAALVAAAWPAHAFCGFYVARADAKLFNQASQVVLSRDGDRTVLTMVSDYQGDPREFAIVVPVPVVLKKDQIHLGEKSTVDHIDAWTGPRLVEYFDPPPCPIVRKYDEVRERRAVAMAEPVPAPAPTAAKARVQILESYTVGEYDILVLSADESDGLESWLRENGYRIPENAGPILASYLAQKMKFFVAKVNLKEQARLGVSSLRPIQMAFESPKFMLPLRLGMVNANGPQDLLVYALTRQGRIETTNYRNTRMPTDLDVPEYVKGEFGPFVKSVFETSWKEAGRDSVFTEYAWPIGVSSAMCDPCTAEMFTEAELRRLGVFWDLNGAQGAPAFVTRLHVRYDLAHFPEDLVFQETHDKTTFQGRYVLHHPWTGEMECASAGAYRASVTKRQRGEAKNLSRITGWSLAAIESKMGLPLDVKPPPKPKTWWNDLWGQ